MPPRESAVFQLVRATDEKHEAGHHRLRVDWRAHEERILKLEAIAQEQGYLLKTLASGSLDLSKATLSPGMVATIMVAVITVVAGQVASTWGLRSDIRDIRTHMDLQVEADRNTQKIQDERHAALRNAVEDIKKKQELQQLELQNLRETLLNPRRRPQ